MSDPNADFQAPPPPPPMQPTTPKRERPVRLRIPAIVLFVLGVLLVVIALLFFGGEVLRGFSFALLVGIVAGTYSSIFMAAPIVLDFDKDKPKPADVKPEVKRAVAQV